MESHALLRINAHEDTFLPVEVKVDWLSKQASMRSRARAMVGRRISQLDDAIRVRALLSIIRSTTTTPPTPAEVSPPTGGVDAAAAADAAVAVAVVVAGATTQGQEPVGKRQQIKSPSAATAGREERHSGSGGVVRRLVRNFSSSIGCGSAAPPPGSQDLEVFARMAVASMKAVLFQLASDDEKRERRDKDLFDVYEGLLTSEALEKSAKAGFPTLDVDSLMLPKHFRYRSLIAARQRFLLRKLGVLLDMEDGVETLLELAEDTETLRDSLADVDLSSPEEEGEEGEEEEEEDEEEQEARDTETSREDRSTSHSAASTLVSPPGAAAAAAGAASGGGAPEVVKVMPMLRNTSWDKDGLGNDDTTEGETDEETMTPQLVHRRRVAEISPSH